MVFILATRIPVLLELNQAEESPLFGQLELEFGLGYWPIFVRCPTLVAHSVSVIWIIIQGIGITTANVSHYKINVSLNYNRFKLVDIL